MKQCSAPRCLISLFLSAFLCIFCFHTRVLADEPTESEESQKTEEAEDDTPLGPELLKETEDTKEDAKEDAEEDAEEDAPLGPDILEEEEDAVLTPQLLEKDSRKTTQPKGEASPTPKKESKVTQKTQSQTPLQATPPTPSLAQKELKTQTKEKPKPQRDPQINRGGAWLLDKVSIIGQSEKLTRVSGSAHRVEEKALEEQKYDDVHRVLKQVPGVYVRDEDGQGLRPNIGLRGANSDRSAKVTLMEDGVLMAPAPYAAPAAYYFPLTSRLVGVEVFKGPASIQYGPNTIGGAINLMTRPTPSQGHIGGLDLSIGMFNTNKTQAYYGYGTDRIGFLIEGARVQSDGFKELDGGGLTGFDKRDMMFKAHWATNPDGEIYHRLDLKLGYTDESSQETYLGLTQEDFEAQPYRRYTASQLGAMNWWRTQAKLDYSLFVGDHLDLKLTFYRHDFSRVWEKLDDLGGDLRLADALSNPNAPRFTSALELLRGERDSDLSDPNDVLIVGRNDRVFLSQGLQMSAQWRAGSTWLKNNLSIGARLHQDQVERDQSQRPYGLIQGTMIVQGEAVDTRQDIGSATAISAFLFDQIQLGERFRLTPGLRMESYQTSLEDRTQAQVTLSEGDEMILLPGIGLWWGFNDYAGVLAGVHKGFSPLSPGLTGKADPEVSLNYEVGARWHSRILSGELIGFYNDYRNLVGTCTQSAGCGMNELDEQFNAGRAGVLGGELVLHSAFKLPAAILAHLQLTYTWTRARFLENFSSGFAQWGADVKSGDELPYLPEHQGSLKLSLERNAFGLGGVYTYVSQMRDRAGSGEPSANELIPAQSLLDLNAYYQASKAGRIYLTLDNALNQSFIASRRPFGARPTKPLLFKMGYQHKF